MATLHRHSWGLITLGVLGLLLTAFALPHLLPGPPQVRYTSWPDNTRLMDRLRSDYGFDRPVPIQFLLWLRRLGTGQWGDSRFSQQPVFRETLQATSTTLILLGWIALVCSLWILLLRGSRRGLRRLGYPPPKGRPLTSFAVLPGFLVAIIFHEVAVWQLGWIGLANISLFHPRYIVDPRVMGFPAAALALLPLSVWSASKPVAGGGHQGWPRRFGVHWQRFQRSFGSLLGIFMLEVLLAEHIFTLPGLGRFGIEALRRRDFPALQGFILGAGLVYLLLRLLCDLSRKTREDSPTACGLPLDDPQRSRYALYRGTLGLIVVLALTVWAPQLWLYNPTEIHARDQLLLPNARYIFGTDFLGRDVLSRTIEGFRSTMPRVMVVTVLAAGLSGLLYGLRRLLARPGDLLWRGGGALLAGIPPFLLAFIVFLAVEHRPWALETALIIACIPLTLQVPVGKHAFRHQVATLARLGEFVLLLDVVFFYLNLSPESLTANWGSDLRIGMHYSNMNMWLLLAPGLPVVWVRYIFRQLQTYGSPSGESPGFFSSDVPTEVGVRLPT